MRKKQLSFEKKVGWLSKKVVHHEIDRGEEPEAMTVTKEGCILRFFSTIISAEIEIEKFSKVRGGRVQIYFAVACGI